VADRTADTVCGLQLDRHSLSRQHHLHRSDALCTQLSWPVYDRRPDWIISRHRAVTSLRPEEAAPQRLYQEIDYARGDMENRIKECKLEFADRTLDSAVHWVLLEQTGQPHRSAF